MNRKKSLRARRRSQLGMTLTEIMIVLVIMAMIATAIGVAVIPAFNRARVKQARIDANTVRTAVEGYLLSNANEGCPTIADLVSSGEIRGSGTTKDPWNHDFRIECRGDDVTVTSAGPDGSFGNDDDVR